jgi:hypothetical protein
MLSVIVPSVDVPKDVSKTQHNDTQHNNIIKGLISITIFPLC